MRTTKLAVCLLLACACDTKPVPEPQPPQTTTTATTAATAKQVEPESQPASALRQVLLDIGCPDDKLLDVGCAELAPRIGKQPEGKALPPCPGEYVLDASCSVYPFGPRVGQQTGRFPPHPIRARAGRFTPSGKAGWLFYLDGGGESRASGQDVIAVAEPDDSGKWSVVAQADLVLNDHNDCWVLHGSGDVDHVLCETSSGSQSCYDTRLELANLRPVKRVNWPEATEECANRKFDAFTVTDLDNDGDDDATLRINGELWHVIQQPDSFEARKP